MHATCMQIRTCDKVNACFHCMLQAQDIVQGYVNLWLYLFVDDQPFEFFVHAAKGGAQPGTTGKKRKRNQPTAQISTQQGTLCI